MHTLFKGAGAAARLGTREAAKQGLKSPQKFVPKRGFNTSPKQKAPEPEIEAPDIEFAHQGRFDGGSTPNSPAMPRFETPTRFAPKLRRDSKKTPEVIKTLFPEFESEYMRAFDNATSELAEGIPVARMSYSAGAQFALASNARTLHRASNDSPAAVMKQQTSKLHTSAAQNSASFLEGGSFGAFSAAREAKKAVATKLLEKSPLKNATEKIIEESRMLLGSEPSSGEVVKAVLLGPTAVLGSHPGISAIDVAAHSALVEGRGAISAVIQAVRKARGYSDDVSITVTQKEVLLKIVGTAGSSAADGLSALAKLVGAVLFTTAVAEGKDKPAGNTNVTIEIDKDAKGIQVSEAEDGSTIVRASQESLDALASAVSENAAGAQASVPEPEVSDVPTLEAPEQVQQEYARTTGDVPYWVQCAGI